MEIIKEYTAEFNMFGDTEKIVIAKYPNGKFYIHYGWMEITNRAQSSPVDMTAWMKRKKC